MRSEKEEMFYRAIRTWSGEHLPNAMFSLVEEPGGLYVSRKPQQEIGNPAKMWCQQLSSTSGT